MGLAIEVGTLSDLLENDPEGADWLREGLAAANKLLVAEGLPTHNEPTDIVIPSSRALLSSFPYSFIHYLRRAYAHRLADPNWMAAPLADSEDPTEDPLVDAELGMMTSHLICHSDAEGYYVPVDFPEILASDGDDLPGGILGSSQRLHAELVFVAPALGIRLQAGELTDEEAARINDLTEEDDGLNREFSAWLALFEAARLSIEHKTAIVFT